MERSSENYLELDFEKILIDKAIQFQNKNNYKMAAGTFLTILDFFPNNKEAQKFLLKIIESKGNKLADQTKAKIERVLKSHPDELAKDKAKSMKVSLTLLQKNIFQLLTRYGTFLQKLSVPEGVHGYPSDPGLNLLAGYIIGDLFKLINSQSSLRQIRISDKEIETLFRENKKDQIHALNQINEFINRNPKMFKELNINKIENEYLKKLISRLTKHGMPSYRAEKLSKELINIIFESFLRD